LGHATIFFNFLSYLLLHSLCNSLLLSLPFQLWSPRSSSSFPVSNLTPSVVRALTSSSVLAIGTKPVHHVGYLIFPGFEALDLVGPHNPLNMLSASYSLKLSIIALTMDPVPAKINHTGMAPKPGVFSNYTPLYITPTHTIDKPPCGLGKRMKSQTFVRLTFI